MPETGTQRFVLALTGTPGTGKTTATRHLPPDYAVIDAGQLAHKISAVEGQDPARDTAIVDEAKLQREARRHLPEGPVVVEGVLAHYCDPDRVLVLRCHPHELRRRLQQRDWEDAKIEENVMAETLDAILQEIDPAHSHELDTTDRTPEQVADCIVELFTQQPVPSHVAHPVGTVDWTATLLDEDP